LFGEFKAAPDIRITTGRLQVVGYLLPDREKVKVRPDLQAPSPPVLVLPSSESDGPRRSKRTGGSPKVKRPGNLLND
jgi:hypothetical protein